MKKLLLIFTCLMLVAPGAQAWTWKECFEKPDKFYTEQILSKENRPDQAIIDEFYDLKQKMGIDRFVILKKANLNQTTKKSSNSELPNHAAAQNNIFSSTVTIDDDLFKKCTTHGFSWSNTIALLHELTHVQKDHGGRADMRQNLQQSVACSALLSFGKMLAKQGAPDSGNLLKGIGMLGIAIVAYNTMHEDLKAESLEVKQHHEYEAEVGARNAAAECGYCDVLENALKHTKMRAKRADTHVANTHRPCGIYPTIAETISMERTALAQCRAKQALANKIRTPLKN